MEGGCLPSPVSEPFSGEDVRALIEGPHATTLAYRPSLSLTGAASSAAKGLPLRVMVETRGEPRVPDNLESCQSRITQDVVVTLRFDDPPLDVVIETTAQAFSSSFAVVQEELGARVAAAIGLPPKKVTFSLTFDESGIQGTIDPNDGCGFAVFPADARCPDWPRVDVDLDRERDGFRPRDALARVDELADVPLRWLDASATTVAALLDTTLTVSLVEVPDVACGPFYVDFCPEALTLPVTIRATAADGSLAADLPAELSVSVARDDSEGICVEGRMAGEIEGFSIIAEDVPVPASALPAAVWSAERGDAALSLRLFMGWGSARPYAEAEVIAVELVDPGLTSPLDATVDSAPTCVVDRPRGRLVTE